jgi:hypothetical protein
MGQRRGKRTALDLIANIPLTDFHRVGDEVLYVIKDKDLTYHSYYNPTGPVGKGLTIFANLNIDGGVEMALDILDREAGKWGFKVRLIMGVLPKYGANARTALEQLKADPRFNNIEKGKFGGQWKAMVKAVESSVENRKLITFKEAVATGKQAKEK